MMSDSLPFRLIFLVMILLGTSAVARASGPQVHDISMAAPDVIHVEIRDPDFIRGRIIQLDRPRPEPNGTWIRHDGSWGMVIGPKRDHLRLADNPPQTFLDRNKVDRASAYKPIGERQIIAVYRKSMPYQSGIFPAANGDTRDGASFRHDIYLKLDGPLPQGRHLIGWPDGLLAADTAFEFDDVSSRASSIHVTQNGHRRSDLAKIGYLSLWLPGAPHQGAVDFRDYGVDHFQILDDAGAQIFEAPIRRRSSPETPEPGNGLPHELLSYSDASAHRIALTQLRGDQFTSREKHDFQTGQRIALEHLRGDQDANALFATVASITPTSFTVTNIEGELPKNLASGATAVLAHSANRAGTFVFELDYSAWQPKEDGNYRLHIPGLGLSNPIIIADNVWEKAALNSLAGLYHHRSGIALDGRFGYVRPSAFRPSPDLTIHQSRLPLAWSSQFNGGFVPFEDATKPGWITDKATPDSFWGGYMDAGDWDRHIQHVETSALLLEVFEDTPANKQLHATGLPKSSEVLDGPEYRGSDDLPDLIHEAIWVLDFFRRLQAEDGSMRGGIESASHPMRGEPSFLEHHAVFAYAPDHIASYKYAAAAAKLARILKSQKADDLASLFSNSALAAYAAAERGYADPDTYYADAIKAGTDFGTFKDVPWQQRKSEIQALAGDYRVAASAALLRLTGDKSYGPIFVAQWRKGSDLYVSRGDAAWDYLNSDQPDEVISAAIREAFLRQAQVVVDAQKQFTYPSMKHPGAPSGWGQGGAPAYNELQLLMRAHQIGHDPEILRTMEQAHHVMLGANQLSQSLVIGLGLRSVGNPLHEDHLAMGVEPPAGITIYGWASQAQTAFGWVFGPPWSPLPETGTAEHAQQRRIDPPRFSLPYFEYLVEHPALVMQQEYTVHQSIGTMAALALYINAQ